MTVRLSPIKIHCASTRTSSSTQQTDTTSNRAKLRPGDSTRNENEQRRNSRRSDRRRKSRKRAAEKFRVAVRIGGVRLKPNHEKKRGWLGGRKKKKETRRKGNRRLGGCTGSKRGGGSARGGEFEERSADRARRVGTEGERRRAEGARATFYNPAKCETRAPF